MFIHGTHKQVHTLLRLNSSSWIKLRMFHCLKSAHDETTSEAPSASCYDTSPEEMAECCILALWQLVLCGRRVITGRQPLHQGWQGPQRFGVCYWPSYRQGLAGCWPINFESQGRAMGFSSAVSARCWDVRDGSNPVSETSKTDCLILWHKTLPTRHRKEAHCFSMVPKNFQCSHPKGCCHHQAMPLA